MDGVDWRIDFRILMPSMRATAREDRGERRVRSATEPPRLLPQLENAFNAATAQRPWGTFIAGLEVPPSQKA